MYTMKYKSEDNTSEYAAVADNHPATSGSTNSTNAMVLSDVTATAHPWQSSVVAILKPLSHTVQTDVSRYQTCHPCL